MSNPVERQRNGAIAIIRLARRARLNAITMQMWDELRAAIEAFDADDTVRCVLIKADGERAFSVGADLSEFAESRIDEAGARRFEARMRPAIQALRACRHPVVSAIQGLCIGGGIEIALQGDIRIGAASSRIGIPVNRVGQLLPIADLEGLLRTLGLSVSLELLLEGRLLDSAEALAKGLLTRVVSDDDLHDAAFEAAGRISSGAPEAARWHKRALRTLAEGRHTDLDPDLPFRAAASEDYREGLRAFLAKREPAFSSS